MAPRVLTQPDPGEPEEPRVVPVDPAAPHPAVPHPAPADLPHSAPADLPLGLPPAGPPPPGTVPRETRPPEPRRGRGGQAVRGLRWALAFVLALLSASLVTGSVLARFARAQLLDTDAYVQTVAPLAEDPQVQAAVTERVTHEVMSRLPIEKLAGDLANAVGLPRAQSIIDLVTPAITNWLTGQVHRIVDEVVHSPQFATVWIQMNRAGHQGLANILTGQDGRFVHTQDATVVIDLGPVLALARQNLVDRGFTLAAHIPDMSIPYPVAQVEQLPTIQKYVRLLQLGGTWLPILALVLLGFAVWAAPNHRRGLLMSLLLTALLLGVALAANQVARDRAAQQAVARGFNRTVTLDVYDTVIRSLLYALGTVLLVVLLGVVWTVLAGPSSGARRLRALVNRGLDHIAAPLGDEPAARSVGRFVRRFFAPIAVLVGLLLAWWLLARPSPATALWVFAVGALLTMLLTVARRVPDPSG
ncbi:hypothetical protein Cs7R123_74300 [Catellatospora sp. TT07R-123]|uniref:hypothetical protein n=1 Tax=Catellatospora sp. TT07R-123 TaxID=2733863 RepID=UPI001B01BAE6|nr:hypothetical protein [Catellatospora sp. TT07R-123]GHJ50088.1 hypothetical protein Cs7R123_74300 [Catellatospora sp. TT07R-123]